MYDTQFSLNALLHVTRSNMNQRYVNVMWSSVIFIGKILVLLDFKGNIICLQGAW